MATSSDKNKNKVKVEILGDHYVLKGNSDSALIEELAVYVNNNMISIQNRFPHLSIKQVAVLSALNIAEQLYKQKEEYDLLIKILEEEKR